MRLQTTRGRRLTWNQWALLLTVLAAVAYVLLRRAGMLPALPCPFRALTGVLCPFCGTTTTLGRLLHGDLAGAVHTNPLIAVVSLVAAAGALLALVQLLVGRGLRVGIRRRRWMLAALVGAVALNWVFVLLR